LAISSRQSWTPPRRSSKTITRSVNKKRPKIDKGKRMKRELKSNRGLKLIKLKQKLISNKGRKRPMKLNLDLSKKLIQLESELKQRPVLSKQERIKKLLIKNNRPKRKLRKRIQK